MPIVVRLPTPLRPFASGRDIVSLGRAGSRGPSTSTIGDALEILFEIHPPLRDRILDDRGELRRHVNVFLGNENVRDLQGLRTPVPPDAEISVIPAVSGG